MPQKDKLQQLWNEHLAVPFLRELTGKYIGGYDAVLLDADIAGCVSTFLKLRRTLDSSRISALRNCHRILTEHLNTLDSYPREYYGRLNKLAELVLAEVR